MFPSEDQLSTAKSWRELYSMLSIPRNTRAQRVVQNFVKTNYPEHYLVNTRRPGRLTDAQFAHIVGASTSIRQVILAGGWRQSGGAYTLVQKRIRKLDLSISHFTGQSHGRGKSIPAKTRSLTDYLVTAGPQIHTHDLKNRLIKEGLKKAVCEVCGETEWCGQAIPIQLDHINGNRHDNRLVNLRIICPNCHAQTPTYSGRNSRKKRELCPHCDQPKKENRQITCGSPLCLAEQIGQYRLVSA